MRGVEGNQYVLKYWTVKSFRLFHNSCTNEKTIKLTNTKGQNYLHLKFDVEGIYKHEMKKAF